MIQKLTVGEDTFTEEMVPDGFFQSMWNLKSCNFSDLSQNPALSQQFDDYEHIRELCNGKHNIPSISRKKPDLDGYGRTSKICFVSLPSTISTLVKMASNTSTSSSTLSLMILVLRKSQNHINFPISCKISGSICERPLYWFIGRKSSSSLELASLLVTETVQLLINNSDKPVVPATRFFLSFSSRISSPVASVAQLYLIKIGA